MPDRFRPRVPDRYRETGACRHRLRYFVLLVARRQRARFEAAAVRERAGALLAEAAAELTCSVLGVEVGANWAVVQVEAPPDVAPSRLAARLREVSARGLRAEFEGLVARGESVWTRAYMVATEPIPEAVAAAFVAAQPSR